MVAIAHGSSAVLTEDVLERVDASRQVVVAALEAGAVVYGVTTGFGSLAEVRLTPEHSTALQHGLLRSHAVAVGDGRHATDVIDRQYFHSVYFREPSGVLFELATLPPGFTVDEPVETLGEALKLPPQYESRRAQLQRVLTPLHNPRGSGSPAAGDGVAGTAEPGATGSPSRVGDPGP